MNITGIICEYNPFHLGHSKQLQEIKQHFPDGGIVCLMSGNYVQRGAPAVFDRMIRAKAALLNGADLVLELPVNGALSSAEGFAQEGVRILSGFCNQLCFGAETADPERLMRTARALLSETFPPALRIHLDKGVSFPAARQAALEDLGVDSSCLRRPNDILAVEYCKAILSGNHLMMPYPILRNGDYHDVNADGENPSATSLRSLIADGYKWDAFTTKEANRCFADAMPHSLVSGERAILARLRCMTEDEFSHIPFGSEGLWRKLMHAVRKESSIEGIIASTKSKRYAQTRIQRMILCAFLGITEDLLNQQAPYTRVLAFNDKGRKILRLARQSGTFINVGKKIDHPWQALEDRCGDLYGLFANGEPDAAGLIQEQRVFYNP